MMLNPGILIVRILLQSNIIAHIVEHTIIKHQILPTKSYIQKLLKSLPYLKHRSLFPNKTQIKTNSFPRFHHVPILPISESKFTVPLMRKTNFIVKSLQSIDQTGFSIDKIKTIFRQIPHRLRTSVNPHAGSFQRLMWCILHRLPLQTYFLTTGSYACGIEYLLYIIGK